MKYTTKNMKYTTKVDRKKYFGYDEEGKIVTTETSDDASNYVNLVAIEKAIENIKGIVNTGLQKIGQAILTIDAGGETLKVSDSTMKPLLEEIAEQIAGGQIEEIEAGKNQKTSPIATQIEEALDGVLENAYNVHDSIQTQLNDNAANNCKEHPGVANVQGREVE